jgi:hypothetical protein
MIEPDRSWKGISDKELLRSFRAGKQLGRSDPQVVSELRLRGFAEETKGEPADAEPSATSRTTTNAVIDRIPARINEPDNLGMSLFGGVLFLAGLYFLFDPSASGSSEIVNLQKLTWGESFTISGAVFLAIAHRPKR